MKLLLFTDPHYCSKEVTCTTRRPMLSYGKIQAMLDASPDADMILCLGDFVDDCGDREENIARITELTALIRSYNKPFFCLRGNHDCHVFTREEFYSHIGTEPPFSITVGKTTLIFLDANYTDAGNAYEVGKVDWTDTRLPDEQVMRLREVLREASEAYIFLHQNLDPDVQHQHILKNAAELRDLIAASGKVKAVIQGHFHEGHDNITDGVRYHTLPAMCEGKRNYFEYLEL